MTDIPIFTYSHWRHGGWYVHGVRYRSGAIGCVSRNYEDRKWRIVCDPRPFEDRPTFKTREEAALAEWRLANEEDGRIDVASFDRTRANTLFSYLYRDAANYKQDETVVLAGPLSLAQARAVVDGTDEEDGFVPSAVGLDDLQERTINGWQPDVDHPFHEIASLALTDDPPTSSLSAREFLSLFLSADWRAAAKQVEAKYAP